MQNLETGIERLLLERDFSDVRRNPFTACRGGCGKRGDLNESEEIKEKLDAVDVFQQKVERNRIEKCHQIAEPAEIECSCNDEIVDGQTDGQAIEQEPSVMGFNSLPPEMKLHLFSFLSASERGRAALVCREWRNHMYDHTVWTVVDLTTFPPQRQSSVSSSVVEKNRVGSEDGSGMDPTEDLYGLYRSSVHGLLSHLSGIIRPSIRVLRVMLDIGDTKDGWNEALIRLLERSRLHHLHTVHFIWNRTPMKLMVRSFSQDMPDSTVLQKSSATDREIEEQEEEEEELSMSVEVAHKLRYTQRRFVNIFERLTTVAPTIKRLSLPFDWSGRSCDLLCSLKFLNRLVLHRYSLFAHVEPSTIARLLSSLPLLTRLSVELWLTSGAGVTMLQFNSLSLQYLDLSRCRGVYVDAVDLPSVSVVKLSHRPWNDCGLVPVRQARARTRSFCKHTEELDEKRNNGEGRGGGGAGPREDAGDDAPAAPRTECVYKILCRGAPRLRQLNEHVLRPDWLTLVGCYDDLDLVLSTVCICPLHTALADDDWVV